MINFPQSCELCNAAYRLQWVIVFFFVFFFSFSSFSFDGLCCLLFCERVNQYIITVLKNDSNIQRTFVIL